MTQAGEEVVRESKLNFVDLAGSERVKKGQLDGHILKEAKHINLSLHLEQVIGALQVGLPELLLLLAYVHLDTYCCAVICCNLQTGPQASMHAFAIQLYSLLRVRREKVKDSIATASTAPAITFGHQR